MKDPTDQVTAFFFLYHLEIDFPIRRQLNGD